MVCLVYSISNYSIYRVEVVPSIPLLSLGLSPFCYILFLNHERFQWVVLPRICFVMELCTKCISFRVHFNISRVSPSRIFQNAEELFSVDSSCKSLISGVFSYRNLGCLQFLQIFAQGLHTKILTEKVTHTNTTDQPQAKAQMHWSHFVA